MNKKIVINDKCNCCGLCFAENGFIDETSEGKAIPKGAGFLSDYDTEKIQAIVKNCPMCAISLIDVATKTNDEIKAMINELCNFQVKYPEKKEIEFDSNTIDVNTPFSIKEGYYEYNSESSAKSACRDEINRLMYSQRNSIIQNILVQYKSNKLRPFYKYEEDGHNFFYKNNLEIEKLLMEIVAEINNYSSNCSIQSDIIKFRAQPAYDVRIEMFEKSWWEQSQTNRVIDDMSGEYYTLNWYTELCDTSDMETYAGTGMFGRDIFKRKYAFIKTNNAFKEIAEDIKKACKSVISYEVVNDAYGLISGIINDYNIVLKKELTKKADILIKALDNL